MRSRMARTASLYFSVEYFSSSDRRAAVGFESPSNETRPIIGACFVLLGSNDLEVGYLSVQRSKLNRTRGLSHACERLGHDGESVARTRLELFDFQQLYLLHRQIH